MRQARRPRLCKPALRLDRAKTAMCGLRWGSAAATSSATTGSASASRPMTSSRRAGAKSTLATSAEAVARCDANAVASAAASCASSSTTLVSSARTFPAAASTAARRRARLAGHAEASEGLGGLATDEATIGHHATRRSQLPQPGTPTSCHYACIGTQMVGGNSLIQRMA